MPSTVTLRDGTVVPMFPPLCRAAMDGDLEKVKALLDAGADIEEKDHNDKSTPLLLAARYEQEEVALELLRRGANVNAQCSGGLTVLSWAGTNNLLKLGQEMIDRGCEVDAVVNGRTTALKDVSWRQGREDFAEMLKDAPRRQRQVAEEKKQAEAEALEKSSREAAVLQQPTKIGRPLTFRR
jgi:ankyrin repeat protein